MPIRIVNLESIKTEDFPAKDVQMKNLPMCFWRRVLPVKDRKEMMMMMNEKKITSSFRVTTESDAGSRLDAERTSFN